MSDSASTPVSGVSDSHDWSDAAGRLLKGELAREGVSLALLADRLQAIGVQETESSVKNKIWRGTFSAVFLMQCLHVLGRERVDLAGLVPGQVNRV